MIQGIRRFPLQMYEDERGWFCELRRDSLLPRPMVQTPVVHSLSRSKHMSSQGSWMQPSASARSCSGAQ